MNSCEKLLCAIINKVTHLGQNEQVSGTILFVQEILIAK